MIWVQMVTVQGSSPGLCVRCCLFQKTSLQAEAAITLGMFQYLDTTLLLSTYVLLSAKNEKTDAFLDRGSRMFQIIIKGSNISAKSVKMFVASK